MDHISHFAFFVVIIKHIQHNIDQVFFIGKPEHICFCWVLKMYFSVELSSSLYKYLDGDFEDQIGFLSQTNSA